MMRITEPTPLLAAESLMSWVARTGREQAGLGPTAFLGLVGLTRREVTAAGPACLDRLAEIGEVPRSSLERAACATVDTHVQLCRGERFHGDFARRGRTTFCPACLLEDADPDGPSRGRRVGRLAWLFSPVRTCAVHRIPLVRFPNPAPDGYFQDMDVVAPDNAALERFAAAATARAVSPLQTYVAARLDGGGGPAWLDGQGIDQAAIASEMVGACVLHGHRFTPRALTDDQWDTAGAEGFRVTSRGEEALFEIFGEMLRNFRDRQGVGGPQAIFGTLYAWVRVARPSRPCGPIRESLRRFILDHMAIEPGTRFPGDMIMRRRRHSVASLAREKGVHPRTLNRALVLTGLMREGDPDRVDGYLSVDARAGELLADRLADATSVKQIPGYLNCNRMQAEHLVREGFILRIGGRDATDATMSNLVAQADVDVFLVRFRSQGVAVESPGPGMRNVIDAAKVAKRKVIDVIRLVLDGDLARVEVLDEDLRLKSVLVDPGEVGRVLDARAARGKLPIREAAARLRLRNGAVCALVNERDRDGRPYLRAFVKGDPMGTETWWFDPLDLEAVAAGHVDLATLAGERRMSINTLRRHLNDAGIEPILSWERLEKLVYRRADL